MSQIARHENEVSITPKDGSLSDGCLGLSAELPALFEEGCRSVVIDLSQTPSIDSTGVRTLLAAHNSLADAGGSISVIHASAEVRRLLETLRLDGPLNLERS